MRVSNDPERGGGPSGAFAEMFRLQAEFQSRLAEETLRYLRRLQGAVVPSAPGTVVVPAADSALEASGGTRSKRRAHARDRKSAAGALPGDTAAHAARRRFRGDVVSGGGIHHRFQAGCAIGRAGNPPGFRDSTRAPSR